MSNRAFNKAAAAYARANKLPWATAKRPTQAQWEAAKAAYRKAQKASSAKGGKKTVRRTAPKAAQRAFANQQARDAYYEAFASGLNGKRRTGLVTPDQLVRLSVAEVERLTGRPQEFILKVRTAAWEANSILV